MYSKNPIFRRSYPNSEIVHEIFNCSWKRLTNAGQFKKESIFDKTIHIALHIRIRLTHACILNNGGHLSIVSWPMKRYCFNIWHISCMKLASTLSRYSKCSENVNIYSTSVFRVTVTLVTPGVVWIECTYNLNSLPPITFNHLISLLDTAFRHSTLKDTLKELVQLCFIANSHGRHTYLVLVRWTYFFGKKMWMLYRQRIRWFYWTCFSTGSLWSYWY